MRCPVCEENLFLPFLKIYDDRYGEPNSYRLVKCEKCDHISTSPRLKEEDLEKLYGTYYPRKNLNIDEIINESKKCQRVFSKLIRWFLGTNNQGQYFLKRGQKVLDRLRKLRFYLRSKILWNTSLWIKNRHKHKPIAEKLNLKIKFGTIHSQNLPENFFDIIVMNQVLEHLPDPDISLKRLLITLKPKGEISCNS